MEQVNKGKKLMIAAIIVSLTITFVTVAFASSVLHVTGKTSEATFEIAQGGFRFMLECLLFLFIYKGHRWARITALILFGLGALIALVLAFESGVFSLIIAIPYAFVFFVLRSKPVKAYQYYKKSGSLEEDMER